MKRIFTLLLTVLAVLSAQAEDYTDKLLVLVNGEGTEQQATLTVNEHEGLYDLVLKNFILMNGDQPMPVGNVELTNITPEQAGSAIFLRASENVTVTAGDAEGVQMWLGPMLGELPVELTAILEGGKLRAIITLDLMSTMGQQIEVRFSEGLVDGTGYHIPNGDFEAWHTSSGNFQEPNAWHSFESASGSLAALAGHHLEKATGRTGSCARIYATSIFGIVANGTMTTGRMNAGSMSATDKANHAYIDMSKSDKDGNGDPFYVSLTSRPDSLVLWMQFKQGTANSAHPYATVSAVITDGTYYQDPADKEYTNVVARGGNNQISVTDGQWRRVSIPFTYLDNNVEPRAILVTVSTNADAGQGSSGDEVLVDDLTLVYNGQLSSLSVDGFAPDKYEYEVTSEAELDNLEAQADGQGAYILKSVETVEGGKQAVFTVYAADLKTKSTYTVSVNGTTRIDAASSHASQRVRTYYNMSGVKTDSPRQGQVYVVKETDGTTLKVRR